MSSKTANQQKVEDFATHILAPQANNAASSARQYRDEAEKEKIWLERFNYFWSEENLSLHAVACLLATLGSLILGWSVYEGFISDLFFSGLDRAPWYAVMGVSAFLSSFALYTSTLGTKAFNAKYREWLLLAAEMSGNQPSIVQYKQAEQASKDQLKFAAMFTFTVSVILVITLQRFVYLTQEQDDASILDFVLLFMPLVSYIFEIITGEMALLWLRRATRQNRMEDLYREFKALQSRTAELDKQILKHYYTNLLEEDQTPMVADVAAALFRAQHRSLDNDRYVDKTPEFAEFKMAEMSASSN